MFEQSLREKRQKKNWHWKRHEELRIYKAKNAVKNLDWVQRGHVQMGIIGEFCICNYFYFKLWVFCSLIEKFANSHDDEYIKIWSKMNPKWHDDEYFLLIAVIIFCEY